MKIMRGEIMNTQVFDAMEENTASGLPATPSVFAALGFEDAEEMQTKARLPSAFFAPSKHAVSLKLKPPLWSA